MVDRSANRTYLEAQHQRGQYDQPLNIEPIGDQAIPRDEWAIQKQTSMILQNDMSRIQVQSFNIAEETEEKTENSL